MILLTLLLAAQIKANPGLKVDGAAIFAQQCSVPYCHGAEGAASRAPALAGRNFSREQLRETILKGRPRFGMPSFASKLDSVALEAVISYIVSLPAPARTQPETESTPAPIKLSKEATAGRDLFFDSERLPSCGACHAVNGVGGSIASPILTISFRAESLNKVNVGGLLTANAAGEPPFPALRQPSASGTIRLIEVDGPLPVVRTFREEEVKLSPGGDWKHSGVVSRYSIPELQSILVWLRSVIKSS